MDKLALAYATTIHKAQGSEYPVVVIPLMTQHYAMLARNGGARRRWSKLRKGLQPLAAGPGTPGRGGTHG